MMRWLLCTAIFSLPVPVALAASGPAELLPSGSVKAEFVQPKFDDKAVAISNRMAAAVGQGKKPPVTQAEQEYMQAKFKAPSLVKVAESSVRVSRKGDVMQIMIAFPGAPEVDGLPGDVASPGTLLHFNARTGEMSVGRMKFGKPRYNEGKAPLDLAGRYVPGYEWTVKKGTMPAAFVHVGRIPNEPGKCLLNLSVMVDPTAPAFGSYRYSCR